MTSCVIRHEPRFAESSHSSSNLTPLNLPTVSLHVNRVDRTSSAGILQLHNHQDDQRHHHDAFYQALRLPSSPISADASDSEIYVPTDVRV
jgi:hypothetical protein